MYVDISSLPGVSNQRLGAEVLGQWTKPLLGMPGCHVRVSTGVPGTLLLRQFSADVLGKQSDLK